LLDISAPIIEVFAGVGFAALRDPSVWRIGRVLACLIGLLLTECVGAMYRAGRGRAFWLGIVVFGSPTALFAIQYMVSKASISVQKALL
jgi:hypothetical protein